MYARLRRPRGWVAATAAVVGALIAASVLISLISDSESPIFDPGSLDTTGLNGATLFATSCSRCHGTDLGGSPLGPPLLDPIYRPGHHPDAAFIAAARVGVRSHHWGFGDMPPVADLSNEELAALITFVRDMQREAGIE